MAFDASRSDSAEPLRFRATRGESGHYETWSSYAHARGGDAASPLATIVYRAREEQRPTTPDDPVGQADDAGSTPTAPGKPKPVRSEKTQEWRDLARGIPWVTFVLGSGCLTAWDTSPALAAGSGEIEAGLRESLSDICEHFQGLWLDELVVVYAQALARERTGDEDATLADVNVRTDIQPPHYSSRVLLAAALATRLYAAAQQSSIHVLGRADREQVSIDLTGADGATIQAEILDPLRFVLDELAAANGERASQDALGKLASAIKRSIDGRALRRTHVELLTAFAWYFMTEGTTVYPGWSELMLFQALEDRSVFMDESVLHTDPNPRPRVSDVRQQADWVYRRIVNVTNNSWKSRTDRETGTGAGVETQRDTFYNLVAKLVQQQAAASDYLPAVKGEPPLPVCFITSFDLELEMALWSEGVDFIVVLPVFAVEDNRPENTSIHWVWTRVSSSSTGGDPPVRTPDLDGSESTPATLELPDGLVNPSHWDSLPAGDLPRELKRGAVPIVVRLTGSPLMSLPEADVLNLTSHTIEVKHALVLDEYTAINQSVQDLRQLGLPKALTEARGGGAPRFWMMLGTQVGDTGVRLRLMAQQLAARIKDQTESAGQARADAPTAGMRRSGVLINDKSQNSDRDLFLWHDFDVVDGRHTERLGDLTQLHIDVAARLKMVERGFAGVKDLPTVRARGARA